MSERKLRAVLMHGPALRRFRSMSTNASDSQKRTAVRPTYFALGIDAEGALHVFCTKDRTVHVLNDGERENTRWLDRRPIGDWMGFVAERRGWVERNYYGGRRNWLLDNLSVRE